MFSGLSARLRLGILAACFLMLPALLQPPGAAAVSEQKLEARRLAAPRSVVLTLHDKSLGITWHRVTGARKYGVVIFPEGVAGPQAIRWVDGGRHYLSAAFKTLPRNGYGGFRIQVFAYAKGYGRSAYSRIKIDQFKRKVERTRHYTQDNQSSLKKAVHTVRECGADGLSVAIGTAAVGAPFVAFSVPIPGIGEVTTGGLAAVAGVAGGGATVACFTGKILGD